MRVILRKETTIQNGIIRRIHYNLHEPCEALGGGGGKKLEEAAKKRKLEIEYKLLKRVGLTDVWIDTS